MKRIMLAHGGGGEESRALLNGIVFKYFTNPALSAMEDAAVLETRGRIAFTTDGYTVSPIFFNGGDIGKLAVTGTVNDLAVMGARPLYLGVSFIIEEGFSIDDLERILVSMKTQLDATGVSVVAGDTKVVPSGSADGIFITTTGIGEVLAEGLSARNVKEGDEIIVTGTVGDHGACIFALRSGVGFETDLKSDCDSLWPLVERLLDAGVAIDAMRDPTRGGLAATLNEWASLSFVGIEVQEDAVPIKPQVRGLCELLGVDPLSLACEGRFVLAVRPEFVKEALCALKGHPLGRDAGVIGQAVSGHPGRVILKSGYGTRRVLEYPSGELLPRIC